MEFTTLCYLEQQEQYLMLHRIKKKEDINKGKWIGVGGHVEPGESPEDCLLREVYEETGLTLTEYRFRGLLTFLYNDNEAEYICLYTATAWEGELRECNEGVLQWIPKKDIMQLSLWEGDRIFHKLLLQDRDFFSLKLVYEGEKLIHAVLDGRDLF
ncbi:MAG: 8-oxo-dGTP diphosphatase [Lachnospiraceae bacterium]|nr:8-oxo-dGTP diphosphatase [Lachnospiraceae bacterium]